MTIFFTIKTPNKFKLLKYIELNIGIFLDYVLGRLYLEIIPVIRIKGFTLVELMIVIAIIGGFGCNRNSSLPKLYHSSTSR